VRFSSLFVLKFGWRRRTVRLDWMLRDGEWEFHLKSEFLLVWFAFKLIQDEFYEWLHFKKRMLLSFDQANKFKSFLLKGFSFLTTIFISIYLYLCIDELIIHFWSSFIIYFFPANLFSFFFLTSAHLQQVMLQVAIKIVHFHFNLFQFGPWNLDKRKESNTSFRL